MRFILYFPNLTGLGNSRCKGFGYGLEGPGAIPEEGECGDFSSLLRVQINHGVHLASCKMSTGALPG